MQIASWFNAQLSRTIIYTSVILSFTLVAKISSSQVSTSIPGSKIGSSTKKSKLLDGSQFKASIVRPGPNDAKHKPLGDVLLFKDGNFSSAICKKYNFADAPYFSKIEDGEIHFLAELTSPTDGKMLWKGTIRGEKLDGTMRWTKKRWYWTIDVEHKIRGKLDKRLFTSVPSAK